MRPMRIGWTFALQLALAGGASADDDAATVLLEGHCVECHHKASPKGGLDLSTRAALLRSGETGPAIVAGDPDKSLLWQLAARKQKPFMPHKRDKLPDADLKTLADWIRAGTPYTRELKPPAALLKPARFAVTEADRNHWAFRPIPKIEGRVGIDAFLGENLRAAGVQPAGLAEPRDALR